MKKIIITEQQLSILKEIKKKEQKEFKLSDLLKHKVPLSDEEKSTCRDRGAVWGDGNTDIGVQKAVVKDKYTKEDRTIYFSHTHRAWHYDNTLLQAIKTFEFIKTTS